MAESQPAIRAIAGMAMYDSDDSSSSASDEENGDPSTEPKSVEWLATSRTKRSTAGNRMKSMLAQEEPDSDLELLFAEDDDDAGFTADEAAGSDEHMDSDSDSDDGGNANGAADDLAGEKELDRERREKRKRGAKDVVPARFRKKVRISVAKGVDGGTAGDSTTPASDIPAPRPKKKSERTSWLPSPADIPVRASSRTTTLLSKEQLHAQMQEREARRLQQLKRMKKKAEQNAATQKRPMTQAERLREAAAMEKHNSKTLSRWEESEKRREEERLRKIRELGSRTLRGPVVTFWSGRGLWGDGRFGGGTGVVEEKPKPPKAKREKKDKDKGKGKEDKDNVEVEEADEPMVAATGHEPVFKKPSPDISKPEGADAAMAGSDTYLQHQTLRPVGEPPQPPEHPRSLMAPPPVPPAQRQSPEASRETSDPMARLMAPPTNPRQASPGPVPSPMAPPPAPSGFLARPPAAPPCTTTSPPESTTPTLLAPRIIVGQPPARTTPPQLSPPAAPPASAGPMPQPSPPRGSSERDDVPTHVLQERTCTNDSPKQPNDAGAAAKDVRASSKPEEPSTRYAIILQNFDNSIVKDKLVQQQILFGKKMTKLSSRSHQILIPAISCSRYPSSQNLFHTPSASSQTNQPATVTPRPASHTTTHTPTRNFRSSAGARTASAARWAPGPAKAPASQPVFLSVSSTPRARDLLQRLSGPRARRGRMRRI